jgi:acetyl esterase/lipase
MHGPHRSRTVAAMVLLMVVVAGGVLWAWRRAIVEQATLDGPERSPVAARRAARIHHDLIVHGVGDGAGVHVDLYLPAPAGKPAPLVIYIQGGEWSTADEKYLLAPALGIAMQREQIALATVSFGVDDDYALDRCASDVASAIRTLFAKADEHGFDATRPLLVGYEAGGWLAALLALSPTWRKGSGLHRSGLSAVVIARGTFDLTGDTMDGHPARGLFMRSFANVDARRAASPLTFVDDGAPPFVLLNGADDQAQWAQQSRDLAVALERAGGPLARNYLVPGRTGAEVLNLAGSDNDVRALLVGLLKPAADPQTAKRPPTSGPWANSDRWIAKPRFSSASFWEHDELVTSHVADERFRSTLRHPMQQPYRLKPLRLERYAAIELSAYLDVRGDALGRGDYVIITNVRGSRQVITRAEIQRHHPQIVIGIDDERELFRLFSFYRPAIAYTWRPDGPPPPEMIRPIGAFLYFPKPPPAPLETSTYAAFGLTADSFLLSTEDPLRAARAAPALVRGALLGSEGCLTCHSHRGEGAHAHHLRASDGTKHGGNALPLEDYPAKVLEDFLFKQATVAARFDFEPLILEPAVQQGLFAHVRGYAQKAD